MIITRVPFRVSFFGGGTDIPVWFERLGSSVLSTTIDKYCYVTARPLPPFFDHKVCLAYSRIELIS
jgi:D-glycero-alpha-D-manno-heptose-7-phosphate kinase